LKPATDSYPLALLPIGNKPLLSYQIEYLERNGVSKIIVVIEKKYLSKLDKYFNNFYKPIYEGTEIELVAVSDEDESANILKLLKDRIVVSHQNQKSTEFMNRKTSSCCKVMYWLTYP
jgi:translation initiation factor eIF-2B subunit gamma